jgi:hypothetical protein
MANRYDQAQPAQDSYFNTFVPLPMEQLTALGMSRKQDLEKNQALVNKAQDATANIQVAPGTKDEITRNKIISDMSNLSMKYANVDLTQPSELQNFRRELRQTVDPNLVNTMEQTHQGYLRYMSAVDKLSQDGEYNPQLDKNKLSSWDSATMGAFSYMPRAYKGKASLFEPLLKNLKPNETIDLKRGVLSSKIDPKDLDAVAKANAEDAASTPQGQDEIELLRQNHPEIAKYYKNDPVQIMRHLINDYGSDRLGGEQLTPLPYEWLRSMSTSNTTEKPALPLSNYDKSSIYSPKSVSDLKDQINTKKISANPADKAWAHDAEIAMKSGTVPISKTDSEKDKLINEFKSSLMETGKFKDQAELDKYLPTILKHATGKYGQLTTGEDRPTFTDEDAKTWDEINNLSGKPTDQGDRGNFLTEPFKALAGAAGSSGKNKNLNIVVAEYTHKFNKLAKEYKGANDQSILNSASGTTSESYDFGLPVYSSGSMFDAIDPATGKKIGREDMGSLSTDVLMHNGNYEINSVDGEQPPAKDSKKFKSLLSDIGTKDLKDVSFRSGTPENNFAPKAEFEYESIDKGKATRHTMEVSLTHPDLQKAVASKLRTLNQDVTASMIEQPHVAQELQTQLYDKPVKYKINMPGNAEADVIVSRIPGTNKFDILNDKGKQITPTAENRSQLISNMYEIISRYKGFFSKSDDTK